MAGRLSSSIGTPCCTRTSLWSAAGARATGAVHEPRHAARVGRGAGAAVHTTARPGCPPPRGGVSGRARAADGLGPEPALSAVRDGLPAQEPDAVMFFAPSYGQAGALEWLGTARHLAPVYSTHNNYHLWGPPPTEPTVAIVIGERRKAARAAVRARRARARPRVRPVHAVAQPDADLGRPGAAGELRGPLVGVSSVRLIAHHLRHEALHRVRGPRLPHLSQRLRQFAGATRAQNQAVGCRFSEPRDPSVTEFSKPFHPRD